MSAEHVARCVARMMAVHGETMVLKRASELSTVTLQGKRLTGDLVDTGGSSAQQQFKVRIGTIELLASSWHNKTPARHDTLVVDGWERSVLDIRPLGDGTTVMLYELEVAG